MLPLKRIIMQEVIRGIENSGIRHDTSVSVEVVAAGIAREAAIELCVVFPDLLHAMIQHPKSKDGC